MKRLAVFSVLVDYPGTRFYNAVHRPFSLIDFGEM